MDFSNRRTYQRRPITAQGWIAASGSDDWHPISTVDVSKGGFGFLSREKLEVESIRQFRLQLPNEDGVMHVIGRIAHCIELEGIGTYRVGVQATSVNIIDVETLLARPASPEPDPRLDLTFTRTIDVPREHVWAAWTRPEYIKQWFTPAPWRTVDCEIDLRPGGAFRTVMESPDGQQFPNVGVYLEIVDNEKLVWTNAMTPGWRPANIDGDNDFAFTAMIELESKGEETVYTATVIHRDEEGRKRHEAMGFYEGWGAALDQLVALARTM
ncbi:uncharacterized protein YndB with AHSA1/START domain [Paucimonas lemoignei]|uniref:Uncharacterized protein YndB with AHSA1/START domain n=1 Tax=Paucimonas lemoignei TaxID=29443 RepID=A0A4R3HRB5_PAULE|nr:SRPBCC family protein [Paucimonas lemoignei]TCS35126.1 uncharacterized protein YndB with AHSA1/START domain [Paucimonas lemoignei]